MSVNIYQIITDKIIQELEKNIIPWRKPWKGGVPINYVSRKAYQGINLLLLPYGGEWLSFKQVQDAGGHVKKGEKSSMVVNDWHVKPFVFPSLFPCMTLLSD